MFLFFRFSVFCGFSGCLVWSTDLGFFHLQCVSSIFQLFPIFEFFWLGAGPGRGGSIYIYICIYLYFLVFKGSLLRKLP